MNMVRDFVYTFDSTSVLELLQHFDIELPTKASRIELLRFEVLSPDSFIWRMAIGNHIYYLYVEDYVPNIAYIYKVLNAYLESNGWKLITVKTPGEPSSEEPGDDEKEILKYEARSGFDKVFLAQAVEDADDSLFSEYAPRGFIRE